MKLRSFFTLIFSLAILFSSQADTIDELKAKAEEGDASAQYELGNAYYDGFKVPKDNELAYTYTKLAADQGHAPAQSFLGFLYLEGRGVNQNYGMALHYYKLSADQGFAEGQYRLGYLYRTGAGVEKDNRAAAYYYKLAADQGYAKAQLALGRLYYKGEGVAQDYLTAYNLLKQASDNNNAEATALIGTMHYNGEGVSKDVEKAFLCYSIAAEQGNATGQNRLAIMYADGEVVEKDLERAFHYYKLAADQGSPAAQFNLANMFAYGEGVEENFEEAYKYYKLAADKKNAKAQGRVGYCYAEGKGVEKNYDEAYKYYKLAADQGDRYGQYGLGLMYFNGNGMPSNRSLAFKYLKLAADQGHVRSQYFVGLLYANGLGVAQNHAEALRYYQMAADKNDKNAQESLANLKREMEVLKLTNQAVSGAESALSSVDVAIPDNGQDKNTTSFAIIIANENYSAAPAVPFALNDGEIFEKYLTKTVGLPADHVKLFKDATLGNIQIAMQYVKNLSDAYGEDLNLIFYYAGHGFPNENSKNAFILPIDGDPLFSDSCFGLDDLIAVLGNLKANSVLVLLDACFSGSSRNDQMLVSARSVALKPNKLTPSGNMVLLSATQDDESAFPYETEKHGLFTFFLLKKLRDNNGNVSIGELCDYVIQQVKRQSVVTNGKVQTPTVSVSPSLQNSWRNLKLKN